MFFRTRPTPPTRHTLWVIIVALLVFLAKTAFLLSSTVRELASTTWIIDDSIIEMAVARNVGRGLGFTLDGVNPTTGAPFLWIYLTSLTHLFFDSGGALKATLVLSTLFGSAATVVTYFLARKVSGSDAVAWTAFLLSTFTANAFFNAMNGMETSFFTLVVLLSFSTFLGVGKPASWSDFSWGCVTGLMLGLTAMTRGDGLFVLVTIAGMALYDCWKATGRERASRVQALLGMGAVAGLCFAFFMGWQLLQTGSPFPANQVGRRGMSLSLHSFSYDDFSLARYLKIVAWNVFQLETLVRIGIGSSVLALFALASALLQDTYRRYAVLVGAYCAVFFTLLVAYQWYFPDFHGLRYINPPVHLLLVLVAVALWQLPAHRWKPAAAGAVAFALVLLAGYRHYDLALHMPWADYNSYVARSSEESLEEFWGLIDWMDENLPAGTVVGVRDYGRVTYFTDLTIQDISGNIYLDAITTLNDGTLDQYLASRGVEYLMIPSLEMRGDQLYQYLHNEMDLELVEEAPKSPTQYLYRIVR